MAVSEQERKYIAGLVGRARTAQEQVADYTQQQIDDVCLAIGWEVYEDANIKQLAELAVEETGMGNVEDKIRKHKGKILGVIADIKGAKSVGLIEEDREKKIKKYAKPVGVVGALTPVTNPTATPGSNAVTVLKGRNAVIFAPHPKAKNASRLAVDYMRKGLKKVGAPEDLIQIIEEPSIELTAELMKQVDIVLATGGGAMVKAAYSSGTPAYGVGPGNSVQIIAEDADVADAVEKISISKVFDYATSCSSENSVIIQKSVYERSIEEFKQRGAHLCSPDELKKLEAWMWRPNKKGHVTINPKIIAQSALRIAADAGLEVPDDTRILLVEGSLPVEEDRFAGEKLSPVLTLYSYDTFRDGLDLLKAVTDNAGRGHSCGIHTFKQDYIEQMSLEMHTSRIMVRQPQAPANGGNFFNGMPSTVTLGCGTWGGNITTENIYYKHFLNITWVSEPFPPKKPSDEEMWGDFWQRRGGPDGKGAGASETRGSVGSGSGQQGVRGHGIAGGRA
ncbi:MAG: aldehyde dehydrogenase family protein [Sediminispirochaetaceae bacterium]